MVTLTAAEEIRLLESVFEPEPDDLLLEIEKIVAEFEPEVNEVAQWCIQIPCAGVTYYAFR